MMMIEWSGSLPIPPGAGPCRVCGCTDDNCRQCVERTGRACYWVTDGLCSACATLVFAAGVTAYDCGVPRQYNPYEMISTTWARAREWFQGWDYAAELERDRIGSGDVVVDE